jgi:hypothetical protein
MQIGIQCDIDIDPCHLIFDEFGLTKPKASSCFGDAIIPWNNGRPDARKGNLD